MSHVVPLITQRRNRHSFSPAAVATLAGLVALLAGGCSFGRASPEDEFAERACSTSLPFAQQLLDEYDTVRLVRPARGPDARAKLLRHALRGKEVAVRYASELGALAVPETNAGGQARQLLRLSATNSVETFADEERRILGLPEDLTRAQSRRSLEHLELAFIMVLSEMTVPPTHIASLVPELKNAFESTDACHELGLIGTG